MTPNKIIQNKLDSMSDNELRACHEALMSTQPILWGPLGWMEYWNAKHEITMQDWGESICSEMNKRKLREGQRT